MQGWALTVARESNVTIAATIPISIAEAASNETESLLRRAELQALCWNDVDLIENRLRVVDSRTETGERSSAVPPTLSERLWCSTAA